MDSYNSKPLRWTLLTLRAILGAVFAYAGYLKTPLNEPWALFAMGIDSYHIVPFRFVEPMARTLPWLEILLGLLLISGFLLRTASTLVSALLVVFIAAMVHAQMAGEAINCGCFGNNEPISKWTMLRDGSLLAASLFVTVMAYLRPRKKA